mgnify:CR=1 FL=1
MTEAQFGQWLTALKSGKYVQYRIALVDNKYTPTKHCCIGVYVDVVHGPFATIDYPDDSELPVQDSLITLNDGPRKGSLHWPLLDRYAGVIWLLESAPELFITVGVSARWGGAV